MKQLTPARFALRFRVLAVVVLLSSWTVAHASTDFFHLTGIVRDFRRAHPDFDVTPSAGPGHYAGSLAYRLDASDYPTYLANGFRVDDQWRDLASHPIAPHLFGGWGAGALMLATDPIVGPGTTFDSWDSAYGPYGGVNVGPEPAIIIGAIMPSITPPALGPSTGPAEYDGSGTSTLSGDLHCASLTVKDGHTLQMDGVVRILCDGDFEMRDDATIALLADASVEVYVLGDVLIQDSMINEGFYEPHRFVLYHLGNGALRIADGAEVYGSLISPNGTLQIPDSGDVYGVVIAQDMHVEDGAGLHIDERSPFNQCGERFADQAGERGPSSAAGITSSGTFADWFKDHPGVNVSARHTITLVRNAGVYEFMTNNFFPADARLFGNEGDVHNLYFTYELDASFTYQACADQFFEFEGNDDAWVFIDGTLAMDLGGIDPATEQHVDFDRLALLDGETYQLLFLYAHRRGPIAEFRIRTNVELATSVEPLTVSTMCD